MFQLQFKDSFAMPVEAPPEPPPEPEPAPDPPSFLPVIPRKSDAQKVTEVLMAASMLVDRGWVRGAWYTNDGAFCASMAIEVASHGMGYSGRIRRRALRQMNFQVNGGTMFSRWRIAYWNDHYARSRENVVDNLKMAAVNVR